LLSLMWLYRSILPHSSNGFILPTFNQGTALKMVKFSCTWRNTTCTHTVTDSYMPNTRVSNIRAKKVLLFGCFTTTTPPLFPRKRSLLRGLPWLDGHCKGNDPHLYRDMNPCCATRNQTLQEINFHVYYYCYYYYYS